MLPSVIKETGERATVVGRTTAVENSHIIIASQHESTFLQENKKTARLKCVTTRMKTSPVVSVWHFTLIHPENTMQMSLLSQAGVP